MMATLFTDGIMPEKYAAYLFSECKYIAAVLDSFIFSYL